MAPDKQHMQHETGQLLFVSISMASTTLQTHVIQTHEPRGEKRRGERRRVGQAS
jgi:hypothetical protein